MTNSIGSDASELFTSVKSKKKERKEQKCKRPTIRTWLNDIDSYDTGFYKLVQDDRRSYYTDRNSKKVKEHDYIDLEFTLADCSRQITLNFSFTDAAEARNRVKKINKLRKALDEMEITINMYLDDKMFKE
jgi:hypothetical protein